MNRVSDHGFPLPLRMSVPDAGRLFWDLGKDASYAAAAGGVIPTRRVGRRLVVPTHLALAAVGMSDDLIARALGIDPEHVETAPSQDAATTTNSHDDTTATGAPSHDTRPHAPTSSNVHHLHGR